MRIKRIMLATDFSTQARHALDYAVELSARLQAPLLMVSAFQIPMYPLPEGAFVAGGPAIAEILDRQRDLAAEARHREEAHESSLVVEGAPANGSCGQRHRTISSWRLARARWLSRAILLDRRPRDADGALSGDGRRALAAPIASLDAITASSTPRAPRRGTLSDARTVRAGTRPPHRAPTPPAVAIPGPRTR
jgi:nucleotide-binding universal stress UspA family protein